MLPKHKKAEIFLFDETDIGHLSKFYASVVRPDYDNWTKIGASGMLC